MCDPISASIAVTAAGTAMTAVNQQQMAASQQAAANDAARRAADMRRQERERQNQMAVEASRRFEQQVAERGQPNQQRDEDQFSLAVMDTVDQLTPDLSVAFLAGQDRATPEIQQSIAQQVAEGSAEARRRVAALARVSAAQNATANRGMGDSLYSLDLQGISGRSRASLGLYGVERDVPGATVIDGGLGQLGSAVQGLGGLGVRHAAGGGTFGGLFGGGSK